MNNNQKKKPDVNVKPLRASNNSEPSSDQEIKEFLIKNQSQPIVFASIDSRKNAHCIAGKFSVEELCWLKEIINRKISHMLDQAINFNVSVETKGVDVEKMASEE